MNVGRDLRWRDRDLRLFYREFRWRMVKMVRNVNAMAIPEKSRRLCSKSRWKNEHVLESGREKNGEPGPSGNSLTLKEESIGDKLRGQNFVKKTHDVGFGIFSDIFVVCCSPLLDYNTIKKIEQQRWSNLYISKGPAKFPMLEVISQTANPTEKRIKTKRKVLAKRRFLQR